MIKLGNLGLLTLLAAGAFGCSVERTQTDESGFYFTGWVYDGLTNERLGTDDTPSYEITVTYGKKGDSQTVDADPGKFWIGPVEPFHDYTISIVVDGNDYRPFYASESFLTGQARGVDGVESHLFEAFVFPSPERLPSPPLTFTIQTPDGTQPDGEIRVTPNNDVGESVLNLQGDIEGSVDGQVWENDADRKFETVVRPVEGGVVTFGEGDLVYGVEYEATVFAADGYALQSFVFRSGITDDQTVVLNRLTEQALAITANSTETDIDGLEEFATIVLTFNQDIELSAAFTPESIDEAIDDGFTFDSLDADGDGDLNIRATDDPDPAADADDAQENGAHFDISGNTLTLFWDKEGSNFFERDTGDPIGFATYNILSIRLKPAGTRNEREVPLSVLLGSPTIGIQVEPIDF